MTARIDSIYCFDYTKDIGHYDSIRDFASIEMTYIGLALSTPKIRVNATPTSFDISSEGSTIIREYTISQLINLREISMELAVNSPKYILIKYFDGTEKYFEYNDTFYLLFKLAFKYKPQEKNEETKISPYAIQKPKESPETSVKTSDIVSNNKSQQTPAQKVTYNKEPQYNQPPQKTYGAGLWIAITILIFLVFISFVTYLSDDNTVENNISTTTETTTYTSPEPEKLSVPEPRSGTVLEGQKLYEGSELTIHASGGESCVVKLKSSSGTTLLSFYVRAGDSVTVNVPEKYMYVYFASGKTWYGPKELFGEKTSYSKDDDLLDFSRYTWEYTLYPITNGNFSETPIDANEF